MTEAIRTAFRQQANFCRAAGSPFTADVLMTLAACLDHDTRTGSAILNWQGDATIDALQLRIAGGLNAVARSRRDGDLSALYQAGSGDFAAIIPRILREYDAALLAWLDSPPQTNEVARSGALWPGVMEVARRFGPTIELIELGSSAGLNLNMDRFGYDFGGTEAGDPASPLQLKPEWTGPAPAPVDVTIVARIGADQNPLDIAQDAVAETLLAYVWPDQKQRVARIEAAIALAKSFPPPLEQGDAADWIEARLATPQSEGVARIVFHSITLVYLSPEGRARVAAALARAGAAATEDRPLAWLSMEFHARVRTAELRLTLWPGGETRLLARVHPHGAEIEWLA
jgi:hypothetical protein